MNTEETRRRATPGLSLIAAALVATLSWSCASDDGQERSGTGPRAGTGQPDPQMKAVLDELASLGPKPIESLSPQEARRQPSPTDAVKSLMQKEGIETSPEPVGNVQNRTVPANGQQIPVRVYTPRDGGGPRPVLVYAHGGGWVIATLDTYDASCRALADMAGCVVVSVNYRQAPEHRFPAAHEDVYDATQWVMQNAGQVGGDPERVAIAGESAGGNLAAAACLMAKDRGGMMPVHQLLVYPIADYAFDTESYREHAQSKPLNREMMKWFFDQYLSSPTDGQNKYVSILRANDLTGLPPATVITAEIDPLRSEGKSFADKLRAAGVDVAYRNYEGVAHEFFGMAKVVDKARDAEQFAAERIKAAFAGG